MQGPYAHKIASNLEDALSISNEWKKAGDCIVFTNGCFDLIHSGHIQYLYEAKQLGNRLIIGVNNDESVQILKGISRPILDIAERLQILSALEMIDLLIPFSEETPFNLIELLNPDVLVKGGDYEIKDIVGAKEVLESGGEVKRLSFKEGRSTSTIIQTIIDKNGK